MSDPILSSMLAAWRPRPIESVSQIAARDLYLSPEYSKVRGPVDLDLYPYLRQPMDDLGPDSPVQVVVFRGPIQGGKTIIGQAFVTASIIAFPGPILWVTDTDTKADLFSKKRFDLMVRDSPTLRALVAEQKSRSRDNTIKLKTFPGGDIQFAGAQSVSGLTSNTFRFVVIDEADDHKANVSYAGSSIALAMGRQTTYEGMAKTLIVSSPKVRGESDIDSWHDRGNQCRYEVPCIACGEYQPLEFDPTDPKTGATTYRLVWDKGDPSSARYLCAFCGRPWTNSDKARFLPAGRWVPQHADCGDGVITSYSLNALYLPVGSYTWAKFARQWDSAVARLEAGDPNEHRTVTNTRLARSYEVHHADEIPPNALMARARRDDERFDGKIPASIRVITIGVDVQKTRLEAQVIGWGRGGEWAVLRYQGIPGGDGTDAEWCDLDDLRKRSWTTTDVRRLWVGLTFIDAGGTDSRPDEVYRYTRTRGKREVIAVRGIAGAGACVERKERTNERRGGVAYRVIRVDTAKEELFRSLAVEKPGPMYAHLPADIDEDYCRGLVAEHCEKSKTGRPVWVKHYERNEPLDTWNYAYAARLVLQIRGHAPDLEEAAEPATTRDRAARSSSAPRQPVDPDETPRHAQDVTYAPTEEAPVDDYWAERGG